MQLFQAIAPLYCMCLGREEQRDDKQQTTLFSSGYIIVVLFIGLNGQKYTYKTQFLLQKGFLC